jgi:hypothetical protein
MPNGNGECISVPREILVISKQVRKLGIGNGAIVQNALAS